ncbi:MAG: DUF2284 domain-containing protein [Muribaculaceae bacterium]|nr:DUF2284 domain-containing protein [Muribaculaceae bacterium]
MFQISHHVAVIPAQDYVDQYRDIDRFLPLCRECNSYNRVWGCPPFNFDLQHLLDSYEQATIYGTKIEFAHDLRCQCTSPQQSREVTREALNEAWDILLPFLYEQEAAHPGSRIFTGRCRLCRPEKCTRPDGKPCRHPQRMRCSLESVGFDIGRTASELLGIDLCWSKNGELPPYVTLVTALFTRDVITPAIPPQRMK